MVEATPKFCPWTYRQLDDGSVAIVLRGGAQDGHVLGRVRLSDATQEGWRLYHDWYSTTPEGQRLARVAAARRRRQRRGAGGRCVT